jgi:hypothetical protein
MDEVLPPGRVKVVKYALQIFRRGALRTTPHLLASDRLLPIAPYGVAFLAIPVDWQQFLLI